MRPMLLLDPRSQSFEIVFLQSHSELLVPGVTPSIAVNAADQLLTVIIDPH